jgi:hypothetical protein
VEAALWSSLTQTQRGVGDVAARKNWVESFRKRRFPAVVIAMTLSSEELAIVQQARQQGLLDQEESLAYLPGWLCSVLSIALVPLSLGFSLVFVPIVWIAQHDRTATRIARLRHQL